MKATVRISLPHEDSIEVDSSKKLIGRCVELLKHFELSGTVFDTLSSVKTDDVWYTEVGVSIDLYDCSKESICYKLWPALKEAYPGLECAHIDVDGKQFCGCVYDYMQASVCPAHVRQEQALLKSAPQMAEEVPCSHSQLIKESVDIVS
jgi:hypothetical protein